MTQRYFATDLYTHADVQHVSTCHGHPQCGKEYKREIIKIYTIGRIREISAYIYTKY